MIEAAELIVPSHLISSAYWLSLLELISPVPHDSIQPVIPVGRDLLLRVVPLIMKER